MAKYPTIKVKLVGQNGNALVILGLTVSAMKRAGVALERIEEFKKEAMSGDYDHLLQTVMEWVEVE